LVLVQQRELPLALGASAAGRAHGAAPLRIRDEQESAVPGDLGQLGEAAQGASALRSVSRRKGHGAESPSRRRRARIFVRYLAGDAATFAELLPDDVELALEAGADSFFGSGEGLDAPSFFGDEYRSEYQPLPLRTKVERLTIFVSPWAPQSSHFSGGGSEIFCSTSLSLPQSWQTYS